MLLHKADHSQIDRPLFCKAEQVQINSDEIARAIEIRPGRYAILQPNEIATIKPVPKILAIQLFCNINETDPNLF